MIAVSGDVKARDCVVVEDIITSLSRNHAFFVISRNTTFTYKGPAAPRSRANSGFAMCSKAASGAAATGCGSRRS